MIPKEHLKNLCKTTSSVSWYESDLDVIRSYIAALPPQPTENEMIHFVQLAFDKAYNTTVKDLSSECKSIHNTPVTKDMMIMFAETIVIDLLTEYFKNECSFPNNVKKYVPVPAVAPAVAPNPAPNGNNDWMWDIPIRLARPVARPAPALRVPQFNIPPLAAAEGGVRAFDGAMRNAINQLADMAQQLNNLQGRAPGAQPDVNFINAAHAAIVAAEDARILNNIEQQAQEPEDD